MQAVKNENIVLNLFFKGFHKHQFHFWFLYFMRKRFPVDNFCLTVPEKIIGEHFCVSKKNPVSKNFMNKRGISRSSVESLLPHSTKKLRRGTLLCFTNFVVSKKFMDRRGGEEDGIITIFCRKYLSHSAQKFRMGTL